MKYVFSVFLGAVCYGILSTIVVTAYGKGYQLGEVVGSQLMIGFVLTLGLCLYTKWRERRKATQHPEHQRAAARKITWQQRLILMAAGAPSGVTGLVYYESLRYIPNSLAIILLFQFTWIGVLVDAVIRRRRPGGIMLVTLGILLTGTVLAAGVMEQGGARLNWTGVVLGLLSAVSYTLFILFNGKALPSVHPAYRSLWMSFGAMMLVFLIFPPNFLINGLLWGDLIWFALLLGFFGAFIPPVLFAIGVPHIGGGMAGILGASELPVAVLLSSLVLHEHVSALKWAGVVIVLIGVAIPELWKRCKHVYWPSADSGL